MQTKVHLVKAMVFLVVIYRCESWTIKDHQRIDALKLLCWRRFLRVPWTARRSNQSILKEINSEYSLEGLMLKLKVQYFAPWCEEPTHWKRPWCWKRLKAREEGPTEEMVGWHHQLNGHEFEQALGVGDGQGSLVCCSPWGSKESDTTEPLNWLSWGLVIIIPPLRAVVPNLIAPGTGFMQNNLSTDQWWGRWFQDDSSTWYLLCTLFLVKHSCWSVRRYWSLA